MAMGRSGKEKNFSGFETIFPSEAYIFVKGLSRREDMTEAQFTALAGKHMDTVFRLAYSYLKNSADAEDVTQDTLLKLYQSEENFQSEEHVRAWLIRVAANECKSLLRSSWRKVEPLEEYMETLDLPSPEHEELFRAVMALPDRYRVLIYLFYYEGYSSDEIARMLDMPAATVRTRLARARTKLKNNLTEAYA